MAFNALSGTISAPDLIATGSFSGSYTGDGTGIQKVLGITNSTTNQGNRRILFYNQSGADYSLDANAGLTFGTNNVLNIPATTASAGLNLAGVVAGTAASTGSYLALDSNNNVVLTSSVGAGGGGSATAQGPVNSIQFHSGSGDISGSAGLIFSGSTLQVSGSGSGGEAMSVTGHMYPGTGDIYDLGSPTKQWRSLYVSSSTIYFGGESLSVKDGSMKFGSGSATKGMRVGFMHLLNHGIDMAPNRVFGLNAFQMKFGGGIAYKRNVVAANYQMLKTDFIVSVQTDTVDSAVTLTLPSASVCLNGQSFIVKDEGGASHTHNIIISASSTDTIDGVGALILESPYAAVNIYTNGSNKFFIY